MAIVFQTTFDVPDWTQGGGLDPDPTGDNIKHNLDQPTDALSYDQILAAANYSGGGGGKGFRHWRGPGSPPGDNDCAGGLRIGTDNPFNLTEFWMRYYVRFEAGFSFQSGGNPVYTKEIYWNQGGTGILVMGIQGSGSWGVNYNGGTNYSSGVTWTSFFGGPNSDGRWICLEYHLKQNGANGLVEMWIDGAHYPLSTTADLGSTPWTNFIVGDNQSALTSSEPDRYTDFDDIVVSDSGYIGPISAGAAASVRALRESEFLTTLEPQTNRRVISKW